MKSVLALASQRTAVIEECDKYRIRVFITFAEGQLSPEVYRQRYPDFGK